MKSLVTLAALALTMAASGAVAGTSVNVNLNGFLPAPPGVQIYVEAGRPYYRERGRVVYLQPVEPRGKRHHGHAYGHEKHEGGHEGHGNPHHGRH